MYREYPPTALLAPFVQCYWVSQQKALSPFHSVYPDGCADIIFNFGSPVENEKRSSQNGNHAFLVGTMTRTIKTRSIGATDLLGIRFWPGTLYLLTGTPMHLLTDGNLSLMDLAPHIFRQSREIMEPLDVPSRVAYINSQLTNYLTNVSIENTRIQGIALDLLKGRLRSQSVSSIANHYGYSVRSLERHFKSYVGVSPKMYLLIGKFIAIKDQLTFDRRSSLTHIAADHGLHDHAHLTHLFQRFGSISPRQFLEKG